MGLHYPFGYLKHMLWPKERLGVKLLIWLPTTKGRELPWFTCMQVACHILLESSWQELQLFFRPHLNQNFTPNVMGLQSCESPNIENLGVGPMAMHREYYKGEVMAFPKSKPWWVLWVRVCPWLIHAPKVF
jgi:hypothetical protein